jgi:hypothetical protein
MSGHPLGDVVVAVQLGSAEEVRQRVVHAGAVLRPNGDVVLAGEAVELPEYAGEHLAARRLPVDDMDIS